MERSQMEHCCPCGKEIGAARLEGYRLSFAGEKKRGIATIVPSPGGHVDGVLWEIREEEREQLEICKERHGLRRMETVTVKDADGRERKATAYTMFEPERDRLASPHSVHLFWMLTGYRAYGIDPQPVFDAVKQVENTLKQQRKQNSRPRTSPER